MIKHTDNKIEAIEFKFFRPIPSAKNNPQTQLIGQMIQDIYKLIAFKNADIKKMIIIANNKIKNYINEQFKLFEDINKNILLINISKNELNKKTKTFQKKYRAL